MASFDTNQQQPPWVPLETKKDCSQGLCSIYCPQLCYIIFPPPPPPSFSFNDDSSGGTTFSPLVIAIIGILTSAFLLVSYYTIISKYCGGFRRPRLHRDPAGPNENHIVDEEEEEEEEEEDDDEGNQSHRHDTWHVSRANGLDEALINKITVCRYKRGDGLVEGTDCSVCLSEFQEEESLRLLPKCSHAFHIQCIDTWLRSHSNCPLCRANIVSVSPLPAPPQLPSAPPIPLQSEISHPEAEGERSNVETVVVIQDFDEEVNYEHDEEDTASKQPFEGQEENISIVEILDDDDVDDVDDGGGGGGGVESDIRRSVFYMDSSHLGRLSVADIVQMNMEDECMVATDNGLSVGSGSCSRNRGEKSRSRNLHCMKSPILMKRSVSNGRVNVLPTQRKGRNSVLPLE